MKAIGSRVVMLLVVMFGAPNDGRPDGIAPTNSTLFSSRLSSLTTAIPKTTVISAVGILILVFTLDASRISAASSYNVLQQRLHNIDLLPFSPPPWG